MIVSPRMPCLAPAEHKFYKHLLTSVKTAAPAIRKSVMLQSATNVQSWCNTYHVQHDQLDIASATPAQSVMLYVLELDSALRCLLRLMEDWGTGGGLQGAGAALAVGLLPCSGVSATSAISTPPEDPAHSSQTWHPGPDPSLHQHFLLGVRSAAIISTGPDRF